VVDYYQQLYASFAVLPPRPSAYLYQAASFPLPGGDPFQLSRPSNGYLWLALFVREGDKPPLLLADVAPRSDRRKDPHSRRGSVSGEQHGHFTFGKGGFSRAFAGHAGIFDIRTFLSAAAWSIVKIGAPQLPALDSSPSTDVFTRPAW